MIIFCKVKRKDIQNKNHNAVVLNIFP